MTALQHRIFHHILVSGKFTVFRIFLMFTAERLLAHSDPVQVVQIPLVVQNGSTAHTGAQYYSVEFAPEETSRN